MPVYLYMCEKWMYIKVKAGISDLFYILWYYVISTSFDMWYA